MMRTILASALLFVGLSAHAVNYSDLWWNPNESGWGINLTQQGNTLFATWFVYGADSKATWFLMSEGVQVINPGSQSPRYEGDLYQTTGPAFLAEPFDPAQVGYTKLGRAIFVFNTPHSATLTYSASDRTITKQIQRISFGAIPFQGNYTLALFGATRGGCFSISNNTGSGTGMFRRNFSELRALGNYLTVRDKQGGGYWITEKSLVGELCTASTETVTRYGRFMNLAGNYSCNDGRQGSFNLNDVEVTTDRMVTFQPIQGALHLFGTFSTTDTVGEKCVATGAFSASGTTCSGPPPFGCDPDWPL